MSITSNFPAIKPTLLLDFANTKQLDSRITFTRASTATYYGTQTAKAEENLVLQSQDLTTTWAATNVTVTANTQAAPDGTTTAETLDDDLTNGAHDVSQVVVTTSGLTYTLSAFLKNGTRQFAILACSGSTISYASAKFDLSAGTLGSTAGSGTGWSVVSSSITSVGNSWYRCTITFVVGTTTGNGVRIGMGTDGTTFTASQRGLEVYTGTDATIFAWGAQLEQRSAVTAYTPTTTQAITNYVPQLLTAASGVARFDHNPTTFESLGLLIEEQRTNLLLYSEQFDNASWTKNNSSITANTVIAPDGALTGDKLVEDTATASHLVLTPAVVVSGSLYTYSTYIKRAERRYALMAVLTAFPTTAIQIDLDTGTVSTGTGSPLNAFCVPAGNGWFRCGFSIAATSSVGGQFNIYASENGLWSSRSYTGDGYSGIYIWGTQVELGAFATSYIPTVASQVTRAADAASMTGTNFSSWYNQAEGSFYASVVLSQTPTQLNSQIIFVASDNTTSNRVIVSLGSGSSGNINALVTTGGVTQAQTTNGSLSTAGAYQYANAYKVNDFASVANGGVAATDTSGTIPVVDRLYLGVNSSGTTTSLTATIRKIAYYPLRVTNAQLQGLTS